MGIEKSHASTSLVIVNALLLFLGTVPGMFLVEHRCVVYLCSLKHARARDEERPFVLLAICRHVGRKKLLVVGGILMTVSHACVCAFVRASEAFSEGSTAAVSFSWLGVVSMYAFTVSFAATWGPVVWVFQNEVLPVRRSTRPLILRFYVCKLAAS
jgi:SP family sugar:H+ symporter-like MFS transporter